MHVCPCCGFVDPQCWRQNRWVSAVDYARWEDFVMEYPGFAGMHHGEVRGDAYCYYYRGKKQRLFVYRWPKFLGPQYYPKTRHLCERHIPRAPAPKGQKTLETAVAAPKLEASV